MVLDRKLLLATTMIAGFAFAAPSLALAQNNPAPGEQAAQEDSEEQQAEEDGGEEIVVTGSRIRRNEFNSSSPIQVITSEQTTLEGLTDTTEILQSSTTASTSGQINNMFTGFVPTGGPGTNTISLRGLGAQRTLVLVNGRRVGPAGVRGKTGPVDLNVFPSSQIERVEILKDGASSIYGSDAVAGVVNIITKTNFDGLEIGAQATQSFEGGGEEYRLNANWGKTFDQGYIAVGADFYRREPLTFGDRDYFGCAEDLVYSPTTGERRDIIDPATGQPKCFNMIHNRIDNLSTGIFYEWDPTATTTNGVATNCNLTGLRGVGNTIRNFGGNAADPRCGLGSAGNPINTNLTRQSIGLIDYDNEFMDRRTAVSPVDRTSIVVNGALDLTATTEMYGELLLNRRESEQQSFRQLFPTVHFNNQYNPFRLGNPNGYPPGFARPVILLKSDGEQQVDYARGVLGLRGELPTIGFMEGWDWDLYAQFSRARAVYGTDFFYNDRVLATIEGTTCNPAPGGNATRDANGNLLYPTGNTGFSCTQVPNGVNYFRPSTNGLGNFTDEEAAFLFGYEEGSTVYEHGFIEGSIAGDLVDLPAGPLGLALGFQVRRERLNDTPGYNEQAGNYRGQTAAGTTRGTDKIKELFAEAEIPILRGVTMAESLTLNVSGRYSDYDSYGAQDTYKLGLNWQIDPTWRLRMAKGTSFRAPALYELYLGNQTSFLGQAQIDPCINWQNSNNPIVQANCAADGIPSNYNAANTGSALITTGGGQGILEAETSETESLGVIFTPSFIDLSVAVDYYDISIENQVGQLSAASILANCYAAPNRAAEPLCTLYTRDLNPASLTFPTILTVDSSFVNISEQTNRGLDLTTRYEHEFPWADMRIDGAFTWILEWETSLFGGAPQESVDLIGSPDFVGNIDVRFDRGDWTFFWGVDMIGLTSNDEFFGGAVFGYQGTGESVYYKQYAEFTAYHDFSVRKRFDDLTVVVGIQNAFDETPPAISTGANGSGRIGEAPLSSQYDWIGRRAFVSFNKRF